MRYPGDIWHYARTRMIVAARANGLDAIDGPYANFRDADGYRRDATWASTLGCVGKWAIHPSQIEIANDVFAPTEKEIETARQMVEAHARPRVVARAPRQRAASCSMRRPTRIFEAVLERARLTGRL